MIIAGGLGCSHISYISNSSAFHRENVCECTVLPEGISPVLPYCTYVTLYASVVLALTEPAWLARLATYACRPLPAALAGAQAGPSQEPPRESPWPSLPRWH